MNASGIESELLFALIGLVPIERCSGLQEAESGMTLPSPIYTRENCRFAFKLEWGVTVFWRSPTIDDVWFAKLASVLESDGIRLWRHRFLPDNMSQFPLSTNPIVAPSHIVQRLKGRLSYILAKDRSVSMQRNFAIRSFGNITTKKVEQYVATQLDHHRVADERVQREVSRMQVHNLDVDLTKFSKTSHGIYWYNLHLVLVHDGRWVNADEHTLVKVREMLLAVSRKYEMEISRAAILTDHLHLAIRCPIAMAPADVALAFLNNLAFTYSMKPVFQFGGYLGTFGEYDEGTVNQD